MLWFRRQNPCRAVSSSACESTGPAWHMRIAANESNQYKFRSTIGCRLRRLRAWRFLTFRLDMTARRECRNGLKRASTGCNTASFDFFSGRGLRLESSERGVYFRYLDDAFFPRQNCFVTSQELVINHTAGCSSRAIVSHPPPYRRKSIRQ